ncbi:MAG: hypothetical protein A2138_27845 [Deltaproteobacteria bacterium RBG_16_71_12]|nr:MAG: hypothetical protein A2138_27845 [Deltaproteobacteria bacterium RBG_16_71_12]
MVAVISPLVTLAPSTIERVWEQLRPEARARVRWLGPRMRAEFFEPLRMIATTEDFAVQFPALLAAYQRMGADIAVDVLTRIPRDELQAAARSVVERRAAELLHAIVSRLDPCDAFAGDEAREATVWLGMALIALWEDFSAADVKELEVRIVESANDPQPQSAEIRQTHLARAMALFAAVEDALLDERELPLLIGAWCDQLFVDVLGTAGELRAAGICVGPLVIPGVPALEQRRRWVRHLVESLPDDDAEEILASLA